MRCKLRSHAWCMNILIFFNGENYDWRLYFRGWWTIIHRFDLWGKMRGSAWGKQIAVELALHEYVKEVILWRLFNDQMILSWEVTPDDITKCDSSERSSKKNRDLKTRKSLWKKKVEVTSLLINSEVLINDNQRMLIHLGKVKRREKNISYFFQMVNDFGNFYRSRFCLLFFSMHFRFH